jgi:hypothetical protein
MPELKLSKPYAQTFEQKKATLCWVGRIPVKTLVPECVERIVGELPVGNRSAILCLYHGDKHIPFLHASNDGTAKFLRMQEMVGQTFDVIVIEPVKLDATQEKIKEVLEP